MFKRLLGRGFLCGGSGFGGLIVHEVVCGGWGAGNVAERGLEFTLILVVDEGGSGFLQEIETGFVLGRWRRRRDMRLLTVERGRWIVAGVGVPRGWLRWLLVFLRSITGRVHMLGLM